MCVCARACVRTRARAEAREHQVPCLIMLHFIPLRQGLLLSLKLVWLPLKLSNRVSATSGYRCLLFMSSVDLNSGFHTCVENTLPRESSPQPRAIFDGSTWTVV